MKRFCDNFVSMFTYNLKNIHYNIIVGSLSLLCVLYVKSTVKLYTLILNLSAVFVFTKNSDIFVLR